MSLNDVCVYVPAWFGTLASAVCGALAYECTGNASAGAVATFLMAILPSHMMRSIGGGFDNESVVISAMCLTFYFHLRSLRDPCPWYYGILSGLAYAFTAATWGGYIFPLNLIGFHTGILVLLRGPRSYIHHAYS